MLIKETNPHPFAVDHRAEADMILEYVTLLGVQTNIIDGQTGSEKKKKEEKIIKLKRRKFKATQYLTTRETAFLLNQCTGMASVS